MANAVYECKFCNEVFQGRGHFLSQGGYCCDKCNFTLVLPARMRGEHL